MTHSFKPVMVVWWRFGKEHEKITGDYTLRANSPEIVSARLDEKRTRFRATPSADWNWYQVSDDLIVERNKLLYNSLLGEDARFFYLKRGITVMTQCHFRAPYQDRQWYLHQVDFYFDQARDSWIMKDRFCDIIVHRDGFYHRLLDLRDLSDAVDLGLVTPAETARILRQTDSIITDISLGLFPYPEIARAQQACQQLGWD